MAARDATNSAPCAPGGPLFTTVCIPTAHRLCPLLPFSYVSRPIGWHQVVCAQPRPVAAATPLPKCHDNASLSLPLAARPPPAARLSSSAATDMCPVLQICLSEGPSLALL